MDRPIKSNRKLIQRSLLASGVVAFVLLSIYGFKMSASMKNTKFVDKSKITIESVSEGEFAEYIPVDGVAMPVKTIYLDVVQGGYVEKKYVEGGFQVKKGDTILKLNNNNLILDFIHKETNMYELINNLQNTRKNLKQGKLMLQKTLSELEYKLDAAKDHYERNSKLYADHVLAEQEFRNSKREYERLQQQLILEIEIRKIDSINTLMQIEQLENSLKRTYRNLELFRNNLNELYVKAPVSGQLATLDVETGQFINTGQRIGQIDDISGFKLRAAIDEHYISKVFMGLPASCELAGKTYELSISRVYQEVKNGKFQVDLYFKPNTAPESIRRGQTLQLRIQLGSAKMATIVPRGGFFMSTGGNWIFVLSPDGKSATKRNISIGKQNPRQYEVLEGLKVGEKVVISSYDGWEEVEKMEF